MNVSIIGAGNLAWHLAPALDNTDFAVKEIFSRDQKNARALVDRLYQARAVDSLDFSASSSRIVIITVNDDAIAEVAREIVMPEDALLIHTSGSQPLDVLDFSASQRTGVLYPLQTFTRTRKVDFREIPIFIESKDPGTERILQKMAQAISKKVHRIDSEQRRALHVGGVFASNFTNHMLTLSKEILSRKKLDFEWLKPLIAETINKSMSLGPEQSQTGPAKRGDMETLDLHMDLLADDPTIAEIYKAVSQDIIDRYSS